MNLETQSSVTQEDQPTHCPYCGVRLQRKTRGKGKPYAQDLILQFLTDHPMEEFYHVQVAVDINVCPSTVSYAIKQLHESGKVIIHRERERRSTRAYVQLAPKICRTICRAPGCDNPIVKREAINQSGFCQRCWTQGKDRFLKR